MLGGGDSFNQKYARELVGGLVGGNAGQVVWGLG